MLSMAQHNFYDIHLHICNGFSMKFPSTYDEGEQIWNCHPDMNNLSCDTKGLLSPFRGGHFLMAVRVSTEAFLIAQSFPKDSNPPPPLCVVGIGLVSSHVEMEQM